MSRLLIAEDEDRIAMFVAKGMRAKGFTVSVVGDGPSAVGNALTGEFDLLVLDVGLPGCDGFEVLRRVRGAGRTAPRRRPSSATAASRSTCAPAGQRSASARST